jgi:23S rRNA pseudouridine1911/1915/1917 synthase
MNLYQRWVADTSGTLPELMLRHSLLNLTSLKHARRIIEKGCCSVNGKIVHVASKKVLQGDSIEVYPLDETWKEEPYSVLFEDDDLLIINKPAGVSVDEQSIKLLLPSKAPLFLVHRLDKWTSGALLLAKKEEVQGALENLFRRREIKKEYLALVDGSVAAEKGKIESPIEVKKRRGGEVICGITKEGHFEAITYYKVLLRAKKETLVLATPKTGRTHQIRVHFSSIGHPVLGDYQYTVALQSRHRPYRSMLHAWILLFRHPSSHRTVYIKAPLPSDFQTLAATIFGDDFERVLCGLS